MVWAGLSNSEETLMGWDGEDGTCPGTMWKRAWGRSHLSLFCWKASPAIRTGYQKFNKGGEREVMQVIIVYRLLLWLRKITFVHMHTLHKKKHCLEIQLLRLIDLWIYFVHQFLEWSWASPSSFPYHSFMPAKYGKKTGSPFFCHCLSWVLREH